MNALKYLSLLPLALLVACAHSKTVLNDRINTHQRTTKHQDEKLSTDSKKHTAEKFSSSSSKKPSAWELSGVMAARNKQKSWTAQVNWLQTSVSSYQIRLFGPLGSGTILISRQGNLVRFRDGSKSVTSKNADELLQKQTGIRLPVTNLYYWVRGIPAPGGISSEKRGSSNQILILKQGGYTIEYPEYTKANNSILPKTIKLQGNGVSVKLVVKRWKV